MDILVKIRQYIENKPKTWQHIGAYVCEHPKEVAGMKIGDLQQALSVSCGSVINFVQSLGCSGYSEFRVLLSQSDHGFRQTSFVSSDSELIKHITDDLHTLTSGLDTTALDTLTERLVACKHVYLIGLHTSAYVAQIISGYLVRSGIPSSVLGEDRTRFCSLLNKDDTVLAISFSGGTDAVNCAVRNAKAAGATVACMTSFPESELAKLCDTVLYIDTSESQNGDFPLISRICQLTVAEMLLSRITQKRKHGEL